MQRLIWLILGVAAVIVVAALARRVSLYRRLFSAAHFQEAYASFTNLLARPPESVAGALSPDGAAGVVTSAGLVLAVTQRIADDALVLHLSLSQHERPTTSAVANRFAFFFLAALKQNRLTLDPFFTASGVYHLVISCASAPLLVNDFELAFQAYQSEYRPLPFIFRTLD